MIFSSRWLETERKQLKEEAGIKRDAMRLTIAHTVVYTKNVSHSPSRRQTPKESALRLSQDP